MFQRDPFPTILSPILRSQLTGYPGYPQIKQEPGTEQYQSPPAHMKAEYYSGGADQLPHSTVGSLVDPRHPRHHLDALTGAARSKPNKPPKPRPVSESRACANSVNIGAANTRTETQSSKETSPLAHTLIISKREFNIKCYFLTAPPQTTKLCAWLGSNNGKSSITLSGYYDC